MSGNLPIFFKEEELLNIYCRSMKIKIGPNGQPKREEEVNQKAALMLTEPRLAGPIGEI